MADSLKQYIDFYASHGEALRANSPAVLNSRRQMALDMLMQARLPRKGDEGYPALSVSDMLAPDFGININRLPCSADPALSFRCGVPNVSTLMAVVANDTFLPTASLQSLLPKGVTVMSLARAAAEHPQWIEPLYDTLAGASRLQPDKPHSRGNAVMEPTAVSRLNTLLAQDGIYVRLESGVCLDKPLQIVNIFNALHLVMGVRRILVDMQPGSAASILLCDHCSPGSPATLSCQVAELFLGEGSKLEYFELEESSAQASRLSEVYASQQQGSELVMSGATLMGGVTRNSAYVDLCGEHASTRMVGMAIASASQIVDNATCVCHHAPKCKSEQVYKYILDGQSAGSFSGLIVVDENAAFTDASQTNRNVLASEQARMHTRPQLEIYCDEVKCSHGSTVGQLDQNAIFYMRQRGIPLEQARTMLMQAFMADVADAVSIPALQSRLRQLIELRLSGRMELCSACEQPNAIN